LKKKGKKERKQFAKQSLLLKVKKNVKIILETATVHTKYITLPLNNTIKDVLSHRKHNAVAEDHFLLSNHFH